MRIHLWRGFHSRQVAQLVEKAWTSDDDLLILCPPHLKSMNFTRFLPEGEVLFHGEWTDRTLLKREPVAYPAIPKLGVFTSGTTHGEPRLVLYSRANITHSLNGILKFFDASKIDSIFCYPQPFHTFGLLLGYVLALEKKLPLHRPEGRYSSAAHEQRAQLTSPGLLTLGTPVHFQDLLSSRKSLAPSYSCIVGGATTSRKLWRSLRDDLKIAEPSLGYGASEASPGVLHLRAGQEPRRDGEVGTPLDGVKIENITDKGYEFSGPNVCMALVNTQVEFPRKIFLSDKLEALDDGSYVFRGRSDFVLNRGGEKFYLESIEEELKSLNLHVMAFTVPHTRLGEELGLLILEKFDPLEIRAHLAKRFLANFDISFFRSVPSFPVNSAHKPNRRLALDYVNSL